MTAPSPDHGHHIQARYIAFILMIDLLWAINMVAIKELVAVIPPLLAVTLRYVVLLVACAMHVRIVPGRMGLLLLAGLIGGAVQFGLGAYAFKITTNLSALAIAGQLGVPLSLILAVVIDGERIAWRRTLGIVLAIAGVMTLVFDPRIVDERLGVLLTFAASACWAVSTLLLKRLSGISVLTIYAWQALVSIPLLLLASLWLEPGGVAALPQVPLGIFGWVVYSALAASLIGHGGLAWLVQRFPVTQITPFTLATPVLSVVVVVLWYGTPVTPLMWVGGCMTLAGVAIITLRTARKSVERKS